MAERQGSAVSRSAVPAMAQRLSAGLNIAANGKLLIR
jgi:hypothetical protein